MFKFYYVSIKKYGDRFKVTYLKKKVDEYSDFDFSLKSDTNSKDGDRFLSSLSRTRSTVFELASCNDWDYFVTLTLDPKKYNRFDLSRFKKDLNQFIRDYRKKGYNISYLFVPQQHLDGAWHIHGLIKGNLESKLFPFVLGKHPLDLVYSPYRNWEDYAAKFGFNSFGKIKNKDAVCGYILRYITRDLNFSSDSGTNLYLCSQGLNRAETFFQGYSTSILSNIEFENDFLATGYIDEVDLPSILQNCY